MSISSDEYKELLDKVDEVSKDIVIFDKSDMYDFGSSLKDVLFHLIGNKNRDEYVEKINKYLNSEIDLVKYPCSEGKETLLPNYYFEVDKNMQEVVAKLRSECITTEFSCQGHYRNGVTESPYITMFMSEDELKILLDIYFKAKDTRTSIQFEVRNIYKARYRVYITMSDKFYVDFDDLNANGKNIEILFKKWIDNELINLVEEFVSRIKR